jgi:hypothetical protein
VLDLPMNSHDTVARPQCGCGATSIPGRGHLVGAVVVDEAPRPDKAAFPGGRVRRTVMARSPPKGTSRGVSTCTSVMDQP